MQQNSKKESYLPECSDRQEHRPVGLEINSEYASNVPPCTTDLFSLLEGAQWKLNMDSYSGVHQCKDLQSVASLESGVVLLMSYAMLCHGQ